MWLAKAAARGTALEKATLMPLEGASGLGRAEGALPQVLATGACRARETCNRKPAIAQRLLLPRQARPPVAHSKKRFEIGTPSWATRLPVAG